MVELKVFVLFLTLAGVDIPPTGVEGPHVLKFDTMQECVSFVQEHMPAWIKNEVDHHKTDELEIYAACYSPAI